MATKKDLNNAFKELRSRGFIAEQNFWCCQTCGCTAVGQLVDEDGKLLKNGRQMEGYVFYHRQDTEGLRKDGECYLAWGSLENNTSTYKTKAIGQQIVKVLKAHSIKVKWDGSTGKRIHIAIEKPKVK